MKKFLAILLSLVMLVGAVPLMTGLTGQEKASVNVGDWLALVDAEFGMTYYEQAEPYFENIPADNRYFAAVQTAVEWGVVSQDEALDVLAAVRTDFMAATLVRAARLTAPAADVQNASRLYGAEDVAIAAGNGIVALTGNGALDNHKITLEDGKAAIATAKALWASRSFDEDVANVKAAESIRDISDLPAAENGEKYTVEKLDNAKEKITLPVTEDTADIMLGEVLVLPATADKPFGAVKKVADVQATANAVEVVAEDADLEDVFETINLETDFAPDFATAQITDESGAVLNQADAAAAEDFSLADSGLATAADETVMLSLLRDDDTAKAMQCAKLTKKPVNINLAIGDYAISGKIDGDKMDFTVSGVIKGAKVTKTYNFSNFNLSTKADINVLRAKIEEAYIRVDYDVVDSTKIEGNYSADLAQYNWGKEALMSDVDAALGTDVLGGLQGAADSVATSINNTFKIASVEIPIPNMPVVSIALDISLRISIDGSVELIVETSNARGYEIINNKGRAISDTVTTKNTVNLGADCRLTANFGLALKLLGLTVVDAGLETGIGAEANATITWFTAQAEPQNSVTADIPIEVALALTDGETYSNVTGNVKVYGILSVSVGQNSSLLKKIGLAKTWVIFDKDNAVLFEYHFDEGNIPVPAETEPAAEEAATNMPTGASAVVPASETFALQAGETLSLADKGTAWTTSNSATAIVDADGVLTAVAAGTATLTGVAADGSPVAVSVTVTEVETADATVVVVSAFRPAATYASI